MLKKKIFAILSAVMLISVLLAVPAMADGTRVVTIGADLSDEQEAFIVNYFGADLKTCEVIYVHNWQEREYLGSSIPLEQIGNITISSAYVQPTNSGGIQVKTANLTYVTGNMIASVMSTAGIKNCNVVAAAPFPVSGTGALTGIMIAYQKATGKQLSEEKKDLAVQEFVVTQQASNSIGEDEALQLVNAVKMEVIASGVSSDDTDTIAEIVNNIEQTIVNDSSTTTNTTTNTAVATNIIDNSITNIDNSVTNVDNSSTYINNGLSDEDRQMIIDLATEIAKQQYDYDDVKETLERVEQNLSNETNINIVIDNSNDNDNENANDIDNSDDINNSDDVINTADAASDNDMISEEENILSNTNDDIIDPNYQSATRDEDISAIEQAIEDAKEEETEDPFSGMYDMNEENFVFEDTDDYSDQNTFDNTYENLDDATFVPGDFYIDEITDNDFVYDQTEDPFYFEETTDIFTWDEPVDTYEPEDIYQQDDIFEEEYIEEETEDIPEVKAQITAEFDSEDNKAVYDHVIRMFVPQAGYSIETGWLDVLDINGYSQYNADLADEKTVIAVKMSDDDLKDLGWTEGTEIDIFLGLKTFAENMNLNVYAESEDSVLYAAKALSDERNDIYLDAKTVKDLAAGQTVNVMTVLKDGASYAELEIEDTMIAAIDSADAVVSDTEYGPVQATAIRLLSEGRTKITVHYYDADGFEIGSGTEISLTVYPESVK